MKVDNGTTNFAVYEDATEFYGMAEATLPEISQITEEVKGAGIAGAFNGAFVGHIEAMTLTLNFRSVTADAIKLAEPRNHQLDLRAAQQYWDNSALLIAAPAFSRFQQFAHLVAQPLRDIINRFQPLLNQIGIDPFHVHPSFTLRRTRSLRSFRKRRKGQVAGL